MLKFWTYNLCLLFVASLVAPIANGSPLPSLGVGSSDQGLLFNLRGFTLNSNHSPWHWQVDPQMNGAASKEISAVFSASGSNGSLTVKTETLASALSLESYGHRWLKDYSAFGFEVLGAKIFQQTNTRGYVIDLVHRGQSRQMRQVVFVKDRTAVIMTCSNQSENFSTALGNCNSIIKTFRWL